MTEDGRELVVGDPLNAGAAMNRSRTGVRAQPNPSVLEDVVDDVLAYAQWMDADPEPPFIRRFREITEGKRTMPKTMARKQHYVPSFLLARWATPKTRKGALATIEVAIGEVVTRSPGKVALQRDLYTLDKGTASINLGVEAFLGIVEENAAEAIKRLEAAPERISMDDRATIAYFLAIQQGRTPPGLEQHGTVARAAAEEAVHAFFQNTTAVADRYREKCNPDADMEEIRAFAIQQITAFKAGRLTIKLPEEAPFQAMAKTVSAIANDVAQMRWTLLIAEDEFIASDHGLAMWDPRLPASRGNAWASSPRAETTFPVGPTACLKITPGAESFSVERADAATVADINLRTYGWADTSAFGTHDQILRDVHQAAENAPGSLPRPLVPKLHRFRADPERPQT